MTAQEIIATATAQHHIDPGRTDADGHSFCVCGAWADGEMEPGWDEHMADIAVAALTDAGLLVEPGGETHTEWSAEPSLTPRYVTGPIESDREIVCPMREPEQAMRDYLRGMRGRPTLVHRTVHTGPWRPTSSEEPT